MFDRILQLSNNNSFLLFGARNTGKTTLLRNVFADKALWIDLLDPEQEARFARHPNDLKAMVMAMPSDQKHVVIDEIQKIPKLLDVVHGLIESTDKQFVMSGSSARQLKRGGANLLAGRAFVYHLFPLTFGELADTFDLSTVLTWGSLPKIFSLTDHERKLFLQAYANTYLKEEIWAEQFVKKLDPFRRFLEVAAQANGKVVNMANIARDVGVDDKTIGSYFSILEDTMIGFFLEPFRHSFRKRLSQKPKFYFFDVGVVRALSGQLTLPMQSGTFTFGDLFEHFIILECMKLSNYYELDYRFSYVRTKDDAEIDLVVERPGKPILLIEIKSSEQLSPQHLQTMNNLLKDFGACEAICLSRDADMKRYGQVAVYPWQEGIRKFFTK